MASNTIATRGIPQSRKVTAAAAVALACWGGAGPALAQQEPSSDGDSVLDAVVVTGLRGVERTVIESPTPIDVVTSAELERTGRADVISALNDVVPSFDAPAKGGNGSTFVVQTGGLRGLNVDQTLILINGKRRHRSSHINARGFLNAGSVPVDLNLIPVSAVERIEVLRDGAAAQYGSDAIAGVINVILKSGGEGGRVNLQYGQNFDQGDGEQRRVDAHKGITFANGAKLDLFGDAREQKASTRAVEIADSVRLYPWLNGVNGQLDPRETTINRLVEPNYGQNPQKAWNYGANFSVPVAAVEAYGWATYGRRNNLLVWNFRPPTQAESLQELYPNGFNPAVLLREADVEFGAGVKGRLGEWDWDAASVYGRDKIGNHGKNTLNASLGPSSPTEFYYGALESWDWATTLDFTRHLDWAGKGLQLSWGLEHRFEKYEVKQGEPLAYAVGSYVIPAGRPGAGTRPVPGAQGQITFQPSEAGTIDRNSGAAYVDLGLDVSDGWFVGLAGRYEHFSDAAGNTLIGKLASRYEFTPTVALRGAISTGFRAPGLAQQRYASTTSTWRTVGTEQVLNLVKYLPVDSPAAIALGAQPLTPEESVSYSLGLTWAPAGRFSATLDAYRIDVDDRISLTGQLSGAAVQQILSNAGIVGQIDTAQYFTNAIDTETYGIDLVNTFRQDLGAWGRLNLNLGLNYNKTRVTHVDPNPPELVALGPDFQLFSRSIRGQSTRSPRYKAHLGLNWRRGPLGLSTSLSRWGDYYFVTADEATDYKVKGKLITGVEGSYNFRDRVTVTVGANNLFNVYPDEIAAPSATRGSGQYPTGTGYGFTGGFYYARLGIGF